MQLFQDLLSYVTMSEEEEGEMTSKQRLKGQKHAFDLVNAERMVYEESGGGSSSTEPLQTDQDVIFKTSDQYVGINDVVYEGDKECLLFNWASTTSKKPMLGTLCHSQAIQHPTLRHS